MKKFTKILFLLLALVAIVTAFTVVALADEEKTLSQPYVVGKDANDPFKDGSFDSELSTYYDKAGTLLGNDTSTKYGKWVVGKSGDNTYLASVPDMPTTLSDTENKDYSFRTPDATYSIWNYPYVSLDFDIMSTDGTFAGSVRADLYGAEKATDRIHQGIQVNVKDMNIPKEAYTWHHITFVGAYNGDGTFTAYIYVNGNLTKKAYVNYNSESVVIDGVTVNPTAFGYAYNTNLKNQYWDALINGITKTDSTTGETKTITFDKSKVTFGSTWSFRGYDSRVSSKHEQWYDNFELTHYKSDWSPDEIGQYHYTVLSGGNYEFPYTVTQATIGDVNYEKIEEAIAAAGKNDVIKLALDGMKISVNKAVTIDTTAVSSYTLLDTNYSQYEEIEPGVFRFIEPDDVEVTDSTGTKRYFIEDLYDVLNSAEGGDTTVKLLQDVYTDMEGFYLKKSLKIDLNGYNFNRCYVYGSTYKPVVNEDGSYEITATNEHYLTYRSNTNPCFFYVDTDNVSFELTSSAGGGIFHNLVMKANYWKVDDDIIRRESVSCGAHNICTVKSNGNNFSFKVNGGIDVYTTTIMDHLNVDAKNINVELEDVNYYNLSANAPLIIKSDWNFNVSIVDSLIFSQGSLTSLFTLGTNSPEKNSERFGRVYVKNSDILKDSTGWGAYIINKRGAGNTEIIFDNCRLRDSGAEGVKDGAALDTYAINGNLGYYKTSSKQESDPVVAGNGWYNLSIKTVNYKYNLPLAVASGSGSCAFPVDTTADIQKPSFDAPKTDTHKDYTYGFNDIVTRDVKVIFMNNSDVVNEATLKAGVDKITIPALSYDAPGSLYLDIFYNWADAAGNLLAADTTVGFEKAEYVYTAVAPAEDNIRYTAGIDDIYFSYVFYAKFHTIVYLPYVEGMEAPALLKGESAFNSGPYLVKINGDTYWAYASWDTTTSVADNLNCTAKFTVDGEAYTQTFAVNALIYAEEILKAPYNDTEKAAIGNFMRYVKMAREEAGLEVSEKFDTLINDSGIAALSESNEAYKDDTIDLDEFFTYVDSIHFAVYDSSTAHYYITLKDTNATLTVSYAESNGNVELRSSGNGIYFTINTRVYDIINPIKLTITMPDETAESGTKTVSVTYSAKAYIYGTNDSFTKAMYEFGIAAKAYREWLLTI